jgi:hypothetical protein
LQIYTVHEPPQPPAEKLERGESLVFVRDGFSWMAALFAPIWMLAHRMWLVLIGYVVLQAALELSLTGLGAAPQWLGASAVGMHVALGFEASSLRRWTLARKGWRMLGAVTGTSAIDAERRFFQAWLAEPPEPAKAIREPATDAGDTSGRSPFRLPWRRLFGARA